MTPRTSPSSPPRRTQEERRTEAEQRLLAAAAQLISETGPASMTLAKVGERAGYSRGLATHHFGSKAALMQRGVSGSQITTVGKGPDSPVASNSTAEGRQRNRRVDLIFSE